MIVYERDRIRVTGIVAGAAVLVAFALLAGRGRRVAKKPSPAATIRFNSTYGFSSAWSRSYFAVLTFSA